MECSDPETESTLQYSRLGCFGFLARGKSFMLVLPACTWVGLLKAWWGRFQWRASDLSCNLTRSTLSRGRRMSDKYIVREMDIPGQGLPFCARQTPRNKIIVQGGACASSQANASRHDQSAPSLLRRSWGEDHSTHQGAQTPPSTNLHRIGAQHPPQVSYLCLTHISCVCLCVVVCFVCCVWPTPPRPGPMGP